MLRYSAYSNVLFEALRADPFYRTLEETVQNRSAMLRYYDLSISEGEAWGKLGEPDKGDYGVSVWSLPLKPDAAQKKKMAKQAALREALGPEGAACFARIEASMAVHEARLDLHDHWYLSILGVSPDRQGEGLGGQLLAPVLAEADALGVPSYLTTFTPRNISFYERHGYENRGGFDEPVTGSPFYILVRPPLP